MKKKFFVFLVTVFAIVCFWGVENSQAATEITSDINEATVWKKENSPYVILKTYFSINAPLTIEPGVVVKSANYYSAMMEIQIKDGDIIAVGTPSEKIVFTTVTDNEYGGDTSFYSAWWKKDSVVGSWKGISAFNSSGKMVFENVLVTYAETGIKQYWVNDDADYKALNLRNSELRSNITGVDLTNAAPEFFEYNSIHNNKIGVRIYISPDHNTEMIPVLRNNSIYDNETGLDGWAGYTGYWPVIDARENWWGDPSGPYFWHWDQNKINPGKGNSVQGYAVMFDPWLGKDPTVGCQENCFSNVLFLPGHQASRLYRKNSDGGEDRLWEPNRNEDVKQLYLDDDGNSIDNGIYARGVVDEVFGFADNVYKGFMESMDSFVAGGNINEWRAFAYDWRMPLEKIVDDGTKLEDGSVANVLSQVREMAASSKSGKVTLIGHSNGGLLAKVIIDRLEKSGEGNLVDRLIMVGTPQVGTPKAAAGLLHGDGSELFYGLLLNKKTAREFGENMASAYNLLPSRKYFDIVQSPIIEFDSDVIDIYDFRSIYGKNIDSFGAFKSFLLGDNGKREEPSSGDMDSPNVLKKDLLSASSDLHDSLLDNWQAPEGMEVVQIAGWGLDTIRGIRYDDCDVIFCPDNLSNLDRQLILTEDGDKVVVIPSAIAIKEAGVNYLNIKKYNDEEIINREHADILEIDSLQKFIKNIIQGNKKTEEYISIEKPEVVNENRRLRYRLHSPLSLHLYDNEGRHTGIVENPGSDIRKFEQQIPNSYYLEFGETKYAGADGQIPQDVLLKGEDFGTFTFEIDEVFGTGETKNTTFENIPVVPGMEVKIAISDVVGKMEIDIDGDGEIDFSIDTGEENMAGASLEIFEKMLDFFEISETAKEGLANKVANIRKQLEKGHYESADAMLENLQHEIKIFSKKNAPEKFRISEEVAEKLILIIERIRAIK